VARYPNTYPFCVILGGMDKKTNKVYTEDDRNQAKGLFESGMALVSVSEDLKIPKRTLQSWKKKFSWESKKPGIHVLSEFEINSLMEAVALQGLDINELAYQIVQGIKTPVKKDGTPDYKVRGKAIFNLLNVLYSNRCAMCTNDFNKSNPGEFI